MGLAFTKYNRESKNNRGLNETEIYFYIKKSGGGQSLYGTTRSGLGLRPLPVCPLPRLGYGFYPHRPRWLLELQPSHPNSRQPDEGGHKEGCAPSKKSADI